MNWLKKFIKNRDGKIIDITLEMNADGNNYVLVSLFGFKLFRKKIDLESVVKNDILKDIDYNEIKTIGYFYRNPNYFEINVTLKDDSKRSYEFNDSEKGYNQYFKLMEILKKTRWVI